MTCQTGQREKETSLPENGQAVPCPKCGDPAVHRILQYGMIGIHRSFSWVECPSCKKADQKSEKMRQDHAVAVRIEQAKERAGIDGPLRQRSFDGYNAQTESQRGALGMARIFAEGDGPIWLAFCGATGTGKSHLAAAIANRVIESRSQSVCYVKLIEMMRRFRATFHQGMEETEQQVANHYRKISLLIVDEFGIRKELTEWERMTLDDILDYRWEQQARTLIISNMTAGQMFKSAGERIESRFAEMGEVVSFTWDDHRKRTDG